MRSPREFIFYAHESETHVEAVRDLRANGIDARLDQSVADQRVDWTLWMGEQVRDADHVLVIGSAAYRRRAEGRADAAEGRGAQWEDRLIRDAFYRDQSNLERWQAGRDQHDQFGRSAVATRVTKEPQLAPPALPRQDENGPNAPRPSHDQRR